MHEAWMSETNPEFYVGMTPEGDQADLELEFETEEAFWEWYYK